MQCSTHNCTSEATNRKSTRFPLCRSHYNQQLYEAKRARVFATSNGGGVRAKAKKRKITGEAELFKTILSEREWKCEECSTRIHEPKPINFAHLYSKGAEPRARLLKENIMILCAVHHDQLDKGDKTKMKIYDTVQAIIQELKLRFTNHSDI